jgi:hypothetical protein
MIGIDRTGRRAPGVIAAAIAGTIMASAMIASTASFAVPRYDGLWSVSIVTEKGDCDRGYRYPIRISNGLLANAGESVFTISGKVGGAGAITGQYGHGLLDRRFVFRLLDGRAARTVIHHCGLARSDKSGIHIHGRRLWIPGSSWSLSSGRPLRAGPVGSAPE